MKKLFIIPVIIFLATLGIIITNFVSNSPKPEKQLTDLTQQKEQQEGEERVRVFDKDSDVLQPIPTADQIQKSKQIQLIRKNAVDSGTIFIIDDKCSLSPLVTHIASGSPIAFFNESSTPQNISVNNVSYTIPSQKRVSIQNLPSEVSQLPLTCGSSNNLRGYIYITTR